MDVTCERCSTEYEFDDALVSEQGTSVRCTQCGFRFKVRRGAAVGAPEVWTVRTVAGETHQFYALRDLKVAIGAGRIDRDDVLSKGSGRPRRLASIAELEPFFGSSQFASTQPGTGDFERRHASKTPSGLGPVQPTEGSVAIPLPRPTTPTVRSDRPVRPLFDEDEVTHSRNRSSLPAPEPPPPRMRSNVPTRVGQPPVDPGLAITTAYGTPRPVTPAPPNVLASHRASSPVLPESSALPEVPLTFAPDPVRVPSSSAYGAPDITEVNPVGLTPIPEPVAPAPAPPNAAPIEFSAPGRASDPVLGGASLSPLATSDSASNPPFVAPLAPPAPPLPVRLDDGTPGRDRYSQHGEDGMEYLGERTSSSTEGRPSSTALRGIVVVLVGGLALFGIAVGVQKWVTSKPTVQAPEGGVLEGYLDAGDVALRDGDLDGAASHYAKASGVAESDPRVTKAQARLSVVRAELAWLELLLLPADDSGRDAARRTYQTRADEARAATEKAAGSSKKDPEVARLLLDSRRISGDLDGAKKLVADLGPIHDADETALSLGALDLAAAAPEWTAIVERLTQAASKEGNLGRARVILVYALARAGEVVKARAELDKVAKFSRPHPLEPSLRRFIERVAKGESVVLQVDEPRPAESASASATGAGNQLKAADEALARGDGRRAEQAYQKVLESDPANVHALFGLSQIARRNGQAGLAMSYLSKVLSLNPGHVGALVGLADLKWETGDKESAKSYYRKAIDLGISGANRDRATERLGQSSPAAPPTFQNPTPGVPDPVPTPAPTFAAPPPTSPEPPAPAPTPSGAPTPAPTTEIPPFGGASETP